ncbi:MAG: hypothetical protein R3C59_09965 [Planctomycetaceae bacterium]
MVKLTEEQRAALQQRPEGITCEDAVTQRVYFLVDADLHQRAMQALQQVEDIAAIQQGIADMEAGRMMSIEESRARTEQALARLSELA